jgi:L-rhamnose isomerase
MEALRIHTKNMRLGEDADLAAVTNQDGGAGDQLALYRKSEYRKKQMCLSMLKSMLKLLKIISNF